MKILYVTYGLPVPPDSGARLRDFNLISRAADRHEVSILSLLEFADELERVAPLRAICHQVDGVVVGRNRISTAATVLEGVLKGRPVATTPYYYWSLARRIREITRAQPFDLVQFEHSFFAPYRDALSPGFDGATVLSMHNIGLHQYLSIYEKANGMARIPAGIKAFLMRDWEARLSNQFDQVIVVSKPDRERMLELGTDCPVSVIENGVDCQKIQVLEPSAKGAAEILFVGTMGYGPNREGIRYFCSEVLPLVRASRPDCSLTIVGSGGLDYLLDLVVPGVVNVTGRVPDVTPYYQRADLAIAPLTSGGGTRLKILEAMAYGRPVVSTTLGAEGLELDDGREVLIADKPGDFASHVLALLQNNGRWNGQVFAARKRVEAKFDWNSIAEKLLESYEEIVFGRHRPGNSEI